MMPGGANNSMVAGKLYRPAGLATGQPSANIRAPDKTDRFGRQVEAICQYKAHPKQRTCTYIQEAG